MRKKEETKPVNDNINVDLSEKLIDAAHSHNLKEVQALLKQGANPNHIRRTNTNGWYSGDTHTALYEAVHSDFKENEKQFIDVVEILLKKGAGKCSILMDSENN